MPRKYKLRQGEVGGEEYKPRRRNKKIQISSEEVKEVVSSTLSATPPSMITSTPDVVMVEMSGTQGATTEVEKSVIEEVEKRVENKEKEEEISEIREVRRVEKAPVREEFGWREYREKKRAEKENKGPDRSRCFLLTFNSKLEEGCAKLKEEDCKYLKIGGVERADSGHLHQHCVIYFKNARYANSLRNKYKHYGDVTAVKMEDKDIQRVMNYTVKDKDMVYESGTKPEQGYRSDLEREIKTHESAADLLRDRPDIYSRNRNGILDYYNQKQEDELLNQVFEECISGEIHKKQIIIVYITGKSGTGKTTCAAKYAHDKFGYQAKDMGYLKFDGNFCNGRRLNSKCLFWREFRSEQLPYTGFYQLCDKLGYAINVKFGSTLIRPEIIVFDSIIPLDAIYMDEHKKYRYQVFRRITKYVEYTRDHKFIELDDELHALQEKFKKYNDDDVADDVEDEKVDVEDDDKDAKEFDQILKDLEK